MYLETIVREDVLLIGGTGRMRRKKSTREEVWAGKVWRKEANLGRRGEPAGGQGTVGDLPGLEMNLKDSKRSQ